jgi:hypothetical protein
LKKKRKKRVLQEISGLARNFCELALTRCHRPAARPEKPYVEVS